jgi:hypothetical protein
MAVSQWKLLGPGTIYKAPLATANPDESTIDYGEAWGGSWVDIGDFPEGSPATVSLTEEVYEAYSEQTATVQAIVRTRKKIVIKGAMFDHTVANMELVLDGTAENTAAAGGGQKGYTEIPFGSSTDVTLYKWGVEARILDDAGNEQPLRWFFHKGFFRSTGDIAYAKTKETMIAFEITVIGDNSQTAGEDLGILQLVTAQATAT